MAKYKGIVTTDAGLELLAKACSGGSVKFTAVKTGDGTYDGTEDLSGMTALKSEKQSFGVSGITRIGTQVRVRSVLSNEGLTTGYNITEVGLFATDPDTDSEVLYAIIVAETGLEDYLPPNEDSPSSITMEIYLMLTETEKDVTFTAEVVAGTYASAEAFQDHVDSITSGATQVGNAKTLDGHGAEYFALAEDLEHHVVTSYSGNTEDEINAIYDSFHENASDGEWYRAKVVHNTTHSVLLAGTYYIEGFRATATWGYQRTVSYRGSDTTDKGVRVFERSINNGTWNEWQRTAYAVDLANYLPLTGGKNITKNLNMVVEGTNMATFSFVNDLHSVQVGVDGNGHFVAWDYTLNKAVWRVKPDGSSTVWDGTATGNLLLTGGTLAKSSIVVLELQNTGSTESYLNFSNATEQLGLLGFRAKNQPVFYESGWANYRTLLHTGNKPNGSYTGNSSATERTIATGGIGQVCLVYSSQGVAVVTTSGVWTPDGFSTDADFGGGNLKTRTTSKYLNDVNTMYLYQVV